MLKILLNNSKYISIDKQINKDKLCSSINFLLNKLFPNTQFNDIITLVINCLKSRKISKWDQKTDQDWSTYLTSKYTLYHLNYYLFFLIIHIY